MATRVHPHSINGELMRRLRKRAGISQERLALQVGTTRRHMIRLENGEHLPSAALRDRIAEAVGDKRREIQAIEDEDEEVAPPMDDLVRALARFARESVREEIGIYRDLFDAEVAE